MPDWSLVMGASESISSEDYDSVFDDWQTSGSYPTDSPAPYREKKKKTTMNHNHPYKDSYRYMKEVKNLISLGQWRSKDGTQTFISDLDDDHLINILAVLRKKVRDLKGDEQLLAKAWLWKMRVERMLRLEEER